MTEDEIQKIGMDLTFMVLRLKERRLTVVINGSVMDRFDDKIVANGSDIEKSSSARLKTELGSLMDDFAKAHKWDDKSSD